jgi:hypothetical protein
MVEGTRGEPARKVHRGAVLGLSWRSEWIVNASIFVDWVGLQ